jgi:hypothetical protein
VGPVPMRRDPLAIRKNLEALASPRLPISKSRSQIRTLAALVPAHCRRAERPRWISRTRPSGSLAGSVDIENVQSEVERFLRVFDLAGRRASAARRIDSVIVLAEIGIAG